MTALERLRQAAELAPPGTSLTLTREALLEALGGVDRLAGPDLTVAELAKRFQRAPSTVRAWLEGARLPGAYKLNGRDWRVPPEAIGAFRAAQRSALTAWRDRIKVAS